MPLQDKRSERGEPSETSSEKTLEIKRKRKRRVASEQAMRVRDGVLDVVGNCRRSATPNALL
jgi:hypothetical protein